MKPICGTASMTVSSSTTRSRCKGSGSTGCWGPNGMTVAFPMLLTFLFCFRLRRFARGLGFQSGLHLGCFLRIEVRDLLIGGRCFAAASFLAFAAMAALTRATFSGSTPARRASRSSEPEGLMTSPVGLDFASGWLARTRPPRPSQRAPWRLSPRPPSSPSREPPSAPAR